MANRHKSQKAGGGRVYYSGGDSNVAKEAKETQQRRHGGKCVGKMDGGAAKPRLDKRARGGRIGADKSPMAPGSARHPFSSAKLGK